MDASLNFGNLLAVLTGSQSGLKVRVAGAPLKLAFDGTMSGQPNIKIDGMLSVDGPSIRGVLAWLGQNPGPEGGFGRFALKAQANVNNGTAALAGVNVELDGNAAEGVLTYTTAGRNNLQGTLAADALDLTPYVSTLQFLTNARSWDQRQFSFDEAGNFDVDLRLSAARVAIGNVQLGRSAVALNLRGHQLTLTVGESQAFGGLARGSFTLAKSESGADFKSQMQFADVDLDKCLGQLFGLRRLEGKGDLAFNVESSGTSIDGLARALNGAATLNSTKGALAGINVEQLLKRLERRPLSGAGDFRSGRTPYDKIKLAVKITNGIAEVDEMRLDGAVIRLGAGGSFSIPAREFDLKGTASLVSSGGDAAAFELPFMMQGPWDDPILLPDPQILIRRSRAPPRPCSRPSRTARRVRRSAPPSSG